MGRALPAALATLAAFMTLAGALAAGSVEDFYRGRHVVIVVGAGAGNEYRAYARLLARHIGRYIPGHPAIAVRRMSGAGSLRAADYLFSTAPRDGSVFGTLSHRMGIAPLIGTARFDSRKFTWLGSITDDDALCVTWNSSAVRTWSDFTSKPSTFGGEAAGADPDNWLRLYKNVFGAKATLVSGYPGIGAIVLAMERGELDGLCGISFSMIRSAYPEWLSTRAVNFIVQAGLQRQPEIAAVPLITELTDDPQRLQVVKLLMTAEAMARPFAAPPGIPTGRKAALIDAFDATMQDPDFLTEAKRRGFNVNPMSASAIDSLLAAAYAMPQDVIAKTRRAVSGE